jgi:hypothetical protein
MSAAEVIKEFKKLPREEQAKVLVFLTQGQEGDPKYIDDESFEKAMDLVMKENADLLRRLAQ